MALSLKPSASTPSASRSLEAASPKAERFRGRANAVQFARGEVSQDLRAAQAKRFGRRQRGVNRRSGGVEGQPVERRLGKPGPGATEVGRAAPHPHGDPVGRLSDQASAILDAERGRRRDLLPAEAPLKHCRFAFPCRKGSARQEQDPQRVGRALAIREVFEDCGRAVGLLFGIIEDEEEALVADGEIELIAMPGEKARGPAPVAQNLRRVRREARFARAAFARDQARVRRLRAAFSPGENRAQVVVAAVERLDEMIVPTKQAEEIRLSVLEGVGKVEPVEARLGHDRLRDPDRRGFEQERAVADDDVGRDGEVAADCRLIDLETGDRGRSLGATAYRFGFPTSKFRAVKSLVVFTSSARKPVPCATSNSSS